VIPVFDGHNDALTRPDYAPLTSARPGRHIDLERMRDGGMRGGIFAVFVDDDPAGPDVFENPVARENGVLEFPLSDPIEHGFAAAAATVAAGRLHALERAGAVRIARAIGDIDEAFSNADGPPVAVLHLEGAEAIDSGLEALELWYAAGLRSLGPVWSRPTAFGHGVPFISPSSPDTGPGLTEPGLKLVDHCAELGIAVDLSHLNEAGFWDVARLDRGPLIASHSGAHQLCPASRNLTDAQLDAIAASGGLVGIVFASTFLRADFGDHADTPLTVIVDHARYVADRIGVDHVALGSDFDGATIPGELGDVAGLPRLLRALASEGGFTAAELEQIAWRNWRRVLDRWWR
jgi:membrane dipeptidase